jgi:hypothetical protein
MGKCETYKVVRGLVVGLVLAIGLFTVVYFNKSSIGIPAIDDFIPDLGQAFNRSVSEFWNPRNSSMRTSKAEIDSLLQKIEDYRGVIPKDVLKTIDELSADLKTLAPN